MRPTIQMVEPELYITYVLNLHCNLSPQRIVNLWSDTQSHYDALQTGRGQIKRLISNYLKKFWEAQPESNGTFSNANDIIWFLNKHRKKWWKFW